MFDHDKVNLKTWNIVIPGDDVFACGRVLKVIASFKVI